MMHYTDLTGLAGVAFVIVSFALRLPLVTRLPVKHRIALVAALFVAVMLPFGALSAAEFMRGITGDLSVPTLLLLALVWRKPAAFSVSQRNLVLVSIALAALALYPFALGLGMFDPYRLGFGDIWFISALLVLVCIAWLRGYTLLVLTISLAVLAWSVGWYESNNLWDYLLDPWVAIYAIAALLKRGVRTLRSIRQS